MKAFTWAVVLGTALTAACAGETTDETDTDETDVEETDTDVEETDETDAEA